MCLQRIVWILANASIWFCAGNVVAQEPINPAKESANVLFVNGHIYTSNPKQPWAEAVAIRDGRIQNVGTNAALNRYHGAKTLVVDLGGRMMLPGMIDNHTHFRWASFGLAGVKVNAARNMNDIEAILIKYAKAHPTESWVYGDGWPYGAYWPSGLPTKELLDRIFPDRPATIMSEDGHSLWVNSRAMAAAGITRDTPNPDGAARGTIVRDPKTGEPTGVME